jgi:dTDP-4-dehydrorhamnose 3,5-epimerase
MPVTIEQTGLPGVFVVHPEVHADQRGYFLETYNEKKYSDAGLNVVFVQDNHSHSVRNVLRGLHYQLSHPQGKLIYVGVGEIFDVAVDIRTGSPTYGKWTGVTLNSTNRWQFYVPPGFAHGFCVLSECADVFYKCTELYRAEDDFGILWNDPQLAIDWPINSPLLSAKDASLRTMRNIPHTELPNF